METKALYIHIPFCSKKCYYCDFPSFCGKGHLTKNYIDALNQEIITKASDFKIATIFIGGGTPTFLSCEEIASLGKIINKLNIIKDYEFTVECNPGTLNREKLQALKDIGVNRLSIGLQSTHDYHLKSIGRIHNYEEFKDNYYLAREMGFDNINVDLIFALPNETLEEWENDLKEVVDINPDHVSCYSLIIEEGTPFYTLYHDGKLTLPDEDTEREMYRSTKKILTKAGYHQYEISNFSKDQKECKHNLVYWDLKDYIACGTGAHSYVNGVRYKNAGTIEEYIRLIKAKGNAFVEEHKNSKEEDIEEFIFMGMRKTQGISKLEFKNRFGIKIEDLYVSVLLKYEKEKLIKNTKERVYFTERGIELSNTVLTDFILDKE